MKNILENPDETGINIKTAAPAHAHHNQTKDNLGAESQELAALEKKNMAAIEKVHQRLRDDEGVQACIEKIKAHPWVRVVERQA